MIMLLGLVDRIWSLLLILIVVVPLVLLTFLIVYLIRRQNRHNQQNSWFHDVDRNYNDIHESDGSPPTEESK